MRWLTFLLTLCASAALAQMPTVSVTTTFTTIYGAPYDIAGTDTAGKVVADAAIHDHEIRTAYIVVGGQSLTNNNTPSIYLKINPGQILNLNPYDGKLYKDGVRPLGPLGAQPAGACLNPDGSDCRDNAVRYLADKILGLTNADGTNKFNRVIYVIYSIGGSAAGQWANGIYTPQLTGIIDFLMRNGIVPTAMLWGNGAADTTLGTSQASYFASMSTVIQTARERGLPFEVPWFIANESWDGTNYSPAVQAAQAQLIDHAKNIYAGSDRDAIGINAPYRQYPSAHFAAAGADLDASGWLAALQAYGTPF